MPLVAAPGRVEGGLDGGGQGQLGEGGDGGGGEHLGVFDAVPGGADPRQADPLGGGAYAVDDGGQGGVADGVEAGLEAGLGAGGDVGGDGLGVEVARCRCAAASAYGACEVGGVRAEGAVDEEVAGGADGAQLTDPLGFLCGRDLFGPVADDPRARASSAASASSAGEVVLAGDVRARALVEGADAERGGAGECGGLGVGALRRGDGWRTRPARTAWWASPVSGASAWKPVARGRPAPGRAARW